MTSGNWTSRSAVELSNHFHQVFRTRPEIAATWSDEEVVRRWLIIAKLKRNGADQIVEPSEPQMAKGRNKPGRIAELRGRLANISIARLDRPRSSRGKAQCDSIVAGADPGPFGHSC